MKLYFLTRKDGWPVELFKNRPILNFIRLLIHCRYITTKKPKYMEPGYFKSNDSCDSPSQKEDIQFVECSFRPPLSDETATIKEKIK